MWKTAQGSSLIEIIFVVVFVGFLILVIGNLPSSINLIGYSFHMSTAREIALRKINDLRAQGYDNLANGTSTISDTKLLELPLGSGNVLVEDCPVDICTGQNENSKAVKVSVYWKEVSEDKALDISTLISKGGL